MKENNSYGMMTSSIYDSSSNSNEKIQKIFGNLSSIDYKDSINNIHYICQKCFEFPNLVIVDNENIKLICQSEECKENSKKIIPLKDAYQRMTYIEPKKCEEIFKCKYHKDEKYIYYCENCGNKCRKCYQDCYDKKHNLFDLNKDILTRKHKDYILKKIRQREKDFINNQKDDFTGKEEENNNNFLFIEESYRFVFQNEDGQNLIKEKCDDDSCEKICREKKEEQLEKELFKIIYIIINDYNNYPNYTHIQNLSYIEKYINYRYGKNLNKLNLEYVFNEDNIEILGDMFVKKNKENCFLVINNSIITELENIISFKSLNDIYGFFNKPKTLEVTLIEKEDKRIIDMSYIFSGISKLIINKSKFSSFDVSYINNMSYMFYNCNNFSYLPDISNWKTDNVINMAYMFSGCSSLKELPDISKWNTCNVHDMNHIFDKCSSLKMLPDIPNWNMNNVIDISSMFSDCTELKFLPDISK